MGFLKFLKRDKSNDRGVEDISDLDMPPPPPNMKTGQTQFPGFQNIGTDQFPELPKLPDLADEPIPKLDKEDDLYKDDMPSLTDESSFQFKDQEDLPPLDENADLGLDSPLPKLDDNDIPLDEPAGAIPRPLFRPKQLPNEMPRPLFGRQPINTKSPPIRGSYQKFEDNAFQEERSLLDHKHSKGPIFVRVERFRGIASGVAAIRNNAKMADETIAKLAEIDQNREKAFEKWHNVILDIQKKFVFVDKTLFKGDKK